jgi:hypothetical protein
VARITHEKRGCAVRGLSSPGKVFKTIITAANRRRLGHLPSSIFNVFYIGYIYTYIMTLFLFKCSVRSQTSSSQTKTSWWFPVYTNYQQLTTLFNTFFMFSLYAFRCLLCIIFRSFTYTSFPAHSKNSLKTLTFLDFLHQLCSTSCS